MMSMYPLLTARVIERPSRSIRPTRLWTATMAGTVLESTVAPGPFVPAAVLSDDSILYPTRNHLENTHGD
jgi:hypothetical protein